MKICLLYEYRDTLVAICKHGANTDSFKVRLTEAFGFAYCYPALLILI